MMKPADAERITGYHVGGISPFGQKKRVPTVLEQSAFEHAQVFMNGGQRGLQVKLDPSMAAAGRRWRGSGKVIRNKVAERRLRPSA